MKRGAGRAMHSSFIEGQVALINSIVNSWSARPLNSLALTGLAFFPGFSFWDDTVAVALKSLISLELKFGLEGYMNQDGALVGSEESLRYFHRTRPDPLLDLRHQEWNLTHLTLIARMEKLSYEPFDFAAHNFPNLISLHIKKMVFRFPAPPTSPLHPSTLEDFIIRHDRLQILSLDTCAMQMKSAGPCRDWATLCNRISQALVNLVQLSIYRWSPRSVDEPETLDQHPNRVPTGWVLGYSLTGMYSGQLRNATIRDPMVADRDHAALQKIGAIREGQGSGARVKQVAMKALDFGGTVLNRMVVSEGSVAEFQSDKDLQIQNDQIL